jgi:hypothetical protein
VKRSAGKLLDSSTVKRQLRERERERESHPKQLYLEFLNSSILNVGKKDDQIQEV